jgi:ribosome modulation factor
MPEFKPITTMEEVMVQDKSDMIAGYHAGLLGDSAPGSDKSRGYWHGWRNGMVDAGHMEGPTPDQYALIEEHQKYQRKH